MTKCEFEGRITEQGRFSKADQVRILLSHFAGKRVRITIELLGKRRSCQQNRFMHGPFFAAVQQAHLEAGQLLSPEEVKDMLKQEFGLKTIRRGISGNDVVVLKSTAQYTTTECEDFMTRIRAHYAQFGFELPFPNEHLLPPTDTEEAHVTA